MDYIESENILTGVADVLQKAFDSLYLQILIDKYGKIIYANDKYAEFMGLTKQEMIGMQIEEIIPNTRLYDAIETGEAKFDELFKYEDGRQLVYSRIPIKNSYGEVQGVVSTSSINTVKTLTELHSQIAQLEKSNIILTKQLHGINYASAVFDTIVGNSEKITELKRILSRVSNSTMPILLTGESGTGKEVFANAIHNASERKKAPFVKVNCAAIPQNLIESELFGYETGTFSGAVKGGKAGKFELANHGTILLDEIEELPLEAQSKLLRVLQEYEVERIGSVKAIPLDIHVICCSNRDLYQMVSEKKFREDLLYRINVIELEIPPLRDRIEDIRLLSLSILEKINRKHQKAFTKVNDEAIKYLSSYGWPGNIRELEHALERACILSDNTELTKSDFLFLESKISKYEKLPHSSDNFFASKDDFEKSTIIEALERYDGNKSKTAKHLGISRSLLYSKLSKYDIKWGCRINGK